VREWQGSSESTRETTIADSEPFHALAVQRIGGHRRCPPTQPAEVPAAHAGAFRPEARTRIGRHMNRRDLLALMGIGGVVFASGLAACAADPAAGPQVAGNPPPPADDVCSLQLSDTHWGFKGPPNPQADVTLEHAIATITRSMSSRTSSSSPGT
jgi:hypothetical protein